MIGANNEAIERLEKIAASKQVGVPGTAIYGGYIEDNETDPTVRGQTKYKTFSNILLNVSIVAAGVRQLLNLVANAKWTLEPADDSPEAERLKDEIELIKDNLKTPWSRVIRKAATYKFYGFGVQAWTPKRMDNGVIGIYRIDPRPQSTITRWLRDEWGDVETIIQQSPETFEELDIPRSRVIYMVDDALNDSPEGLGLFRHLAEPARRLERYKQLEGWGFEGDLRGIPIGRGPFTQLRMDVNSGKLSNADRLAIETPMNTFIQKHIKTPELGLLLDSMTYTDPDGKISSVPQWDIDLLKSSNSSQGDVANAIVRLTGDLARILHAEGLLLGSGPNGSEALSKDKSTNLALMVESVLTEIAESYHQDFIKPHAFLNGWDSKLLPKLKAESIGFKSVEVVTQAMADLARAGAMLDPEDPVINHVRELLGAPDAIVFSGGDSEENLSLTGNKTNLDDIDSNDLEEENGSE